MKGYGQWLKEPAGDSCSGLTDHAQESVIRLGALRLHSCCQSGSQRKGPLAAGK